jgi:hypothetical protein
MSWASPRVFFYRLRLRCLVGDKLFVDYSGQKVAIVDLVTDMVPEAEIFVGGLVSKRGVETGC